jgi:hypothetical protein
LADNLTPDRPVLVSGQFHARISEAVLDPITTTALALEYGEDGDTRRRAVLVSCDLVTIPDGLREAVRGHVREMLPALDPYCVFINATHTHTGPEVRVEGDALQTRGGNVPTRMGVDLDVMDPAEYTHAAARRIAETVREAWQSREPGGISFGLGHATVGYNRRICYYTGKSRMYGNMNDPEFSHIEGGSDSSVNALFTWDAEGGLTGVVVNVPCPSQSIEGEFAISADYWHQTRLELHRRLGEKLFVLPQCSPAGDQAPAKPSITIGWEAQKRMWELLGRTQREDIGIRIANAVETALAGARDTVDTQPLLEHKWASVPLPRRRLTQKDVDDAEAEAATLRAKYEELKADLEAHPERCNEPRWYVAITAAYRRMQWNAKVRERFEQEATIPEIEIEAHVLRLGDIAIATNPFEYYLDYGLQIKASTPVGPEGGRKLVDWTVETINGLWED